MAVSSKLMGLLLLAAAGAASAQSSNFVLTYTNDGGASAVQAAAFGGKFEVALNPALDQVALNTGILLTKTTLAPCMVRVMHTHRGVDELVLSVAGRIAVAAAYPNGTIVRDVLKAGQQSFLAVRDWVHSVYNPDCKISGTYLSFFNSRDAATSNIAAAAFNINAGPFPAYTAPKFQDSVRSALSNFAFDPQCLARCKLGVKGGMQPAMVAMP